MIAFRLKTYDLESIFLFAGNVLPISMNAALGPSRVSSICLIPEVAIVVWWLYLWAVQIRIYVK